jgi:uncharacterized membrane protein
MRMHPPLAKLRYFARDRSGNVAIIAALFMVVVMGIAALGVDVGNLFADRRKAQSTTDIAAMVAAGNIPNAANAVAAAISSNNFSSAAPLRFKSASTLPIHRFRPRKDSRHRR